MKEKHYLVMWTIDEFAESPLKAAQLAFKHMQSPTEATVFDVVDIKTTEKFQIDLLEEGEEENEHKV